NCAEPGAAEAAGEPGDGIAMGPAKPPPPGRVIDLGGPVPGTDPDVLEERVEQVPDEGRFSDQVRDNLEKYPLPGVPQPDLSDWEDWDGEVIMGPDGPQIVVPQDEAREAMWGWVIQIIAGTVGTLAGWTAAALCTASLGPEAVVACGAIQGYVTTFLWVMVSGLLGGQSITDPQLWAASLAGGIVAAVGGAVWGKWLKPWVDANAQPLLRKIGDAVGNAATAFGSSVIRGLQRVRDFVFDVADTIDLEFWKAARRLGYEG
ncbi:MAG: hypothetical protein AVDCRST_MAG41-4570, partial [uncultured Corynebacteriales bacterium]